MLPNNLGISLADYGSGSLDNQVLFDSANVSAEQLAELSKALEAGQITGRDTANLTNASGAPLKVESLENTLKILSFKESDIQFWKRVPKMPAFNTVEEFNQLQSYGGQGGVFQNEGELPNEENSTYVRKAEIVKFMGVTKSVSHPMQLVRTNVGPAIQLEIKNGTLHLLRAADRMLAYGDSKIIPQEFNGYYAQQLASFTSLAGYMSSDVVIDLRGKALKEKDIEQGSLAIITNFGQPNLLMAPPIVLSDFVKNFYDAKFIQPNTSALTAGTMGQRVQKFQSQFGEIELGYDIFLNANPARKTGDPATAAQAPAVPVAISAAVVAGPVATSQFDATSTGAGDYYYGVAAINRYGESAILDINGGALLTVTATDVVDLSFSAGAGVYAATGYVIYRSLINPVGAIGVTPLFPIFTVSVAELAAGYDGGAVTVVRDNNRWIGGCQKAMLLQGDEEVYSFKQLAPLMKMDLATLAPSTRFMILMYGTPMLYAPKKLVTIINIGRDLS